MQVTLLPGDGRAITVHELRIDTLHHRHPYFGTPYDRETTASAVVFLEYDQGELPHRGEASLHIKHDPGPDGVTREELLRGLYRVDRMGTTDWEHPGAVRLELSFTGLVDSDKWWSRPLRPEPRKPYKTAWEHLLDNVL